MLDQKAVDAVSQVVRVSQIIVFALLSGVIVFMGYVLFMSSEPPRPGMVTYMSLGVAVMQGVVSVVLPRIVRNGNRGRIATGNWQPGEGQKLADSDASKLLAGYQTSLVIGCALLEGAAFFCMVAFLLERSPLTLAMTGLLVIGLALRFPTRDRVGGWLEDELRELENERQLRG